MKKLNKYLLISFLFLSIASFAQKIKIKKGVVLIDKVESALIKEEGRNDYTYSDLNTKKPVFRSKLVAEKISEELIKQWIEVSSPDGSIKTEIPYEMLTFSLSMKKVFTLLFLKKYKLIQKGSIDHNAVKSFFEEERPLISEEVKELIKGEVQREKDIADIGGFDVDMKRNYIFKDKLPYSYDRKGPVKQEELDTYDNYLGYFYLTKNSTASYKDISTLKFFDLSKRNVAIASFGNFGDVSIVLPHKEQGKTIKYKSKVKFMERGSDLKRKLVDEALRYVIYEGVTLGNQLSEEKAHNFALQMEQYEEAKNNSVNIYRKEGYAFDKNGKKYEGKITIYFEKLPMANPIGKGSDMEQDLANYGKIVSVNYKNKEDKYRIKRLASKNGGKFCLVSPNGTEDICFRGVKLKGKGLELAAGAMSSLNFDTSSFLQIIDEKPKSVVYYDIVSEKFSIKLKEEKKGYQFNLSNTEKNITDLVEYLGKELPKNLVELDYSKKESAIELAKFINKI